MSYMPIGSERAPTNPGKNGQLPTTQGTRVAAQGPSAAAADPDSTCSSKVREDYPIIVHCHLCWDWVWQRPQQFVSRLSQRHPILFVELVGPDAQLAAPLARFHTPEGLPNITVLRLQFPTWQWEDSALVDAERRRLVTEFITTGPLAGKFDHPVQWFYDPMAVTAFAGRMGEVQTVYDCMDELSQFKGAPPELLEREAELLARADVVFTGGRKLYESKSRFHNNCHFYGCGVDGEHFGKARSTETPLPQDVDGLPRPIFGYFGVVDERLDYELIGRLAEANGAGSVVMVGPTIKVEPEALPRRANLHWLGKRDYADLPAYCKAFDVCLMPFALNAATEFINPTKALEYMATGKPIVSTPVADVVRNFGEVVKIGKAEGEFIELCRQQAQQADGDAIQRGLKKVEENSWERIVADLERHVQETMRSSKFEARSPK